MSNQNNNIVKFSFFDGIKFPFAVIFSNAKNFIKLSSFFSVFTCLLFFLFYVFTCWGIEKCMPSTGAFATSLLFFLFCAAVFIDLWQKIAFGNEKIISIMKTFSITRTLKVFYFLLFIAFAILVVFGGIYYLNNRVVTADFVKELVIFVVVSLFVCVNVFVILGSAVFVPYYNKNKKYYITKLCWSIVDNIYIILGWFIGFLFILYVIISMLNTFVLAFLPQILENFVTFFTVYFVISIWISVINYQYKCIADSDN